jgi:hypothetical protein
MKNKLPVMDRPIARPAGVQDCCMQWTGNMIPPPLQLPKIKNESRKTIFLGEP